VACPWIVYPNYYVFRLYEGTAHTNLLDWTSVTTQRPPDSNFGFNYWPYQSSCACLKDANWTTSMKNTIEKDLDHMSSLTAQVLRLMFWPQKSGYTLDGQGQGGTVGSEHTEICDNLPELLQMCDERDIRVVICFGNNYLNCKYDQNTYWWQWAYGDTQAGFDEFCADSEDWIEGIVDACENSSYHKTVIYYDYENECCNTWDNVWDYLIHMYDNCGVPQGKHGVSIMRVSSDLDYLVSSLDGRRLDCVEFHSYPYYPINSDIPDCYATMKGEFPDSTVLVGEFGRPCEDSSEEADQQDDVLDIAADCITEDIPYYLHWMLWDETPGPNGTGAVGWGYDPHSAKDVLGGMSELLNLIPNPDMETLQGGQPQYWQAAGTVDLSFYYGNGYADSATNYRYARIKVDGETSGKVWMSSYMVEVDGGSQLYANAYIRSGMYDISVNVVEYDSNQTKIKSTTGPLFTPTGWSMNNYLHRVGPHSVTLTADTAWVIVSISGYVDSDPDYLDVDAVSVWTRP